MEEEKKRNEGKSEEKVWFNNITPSESELPRFNMPKFDVPALQLAAASVVKSFAENYLKVTRALETAAQSVYESYSNIDWEETERTWKEAVEDLSRRGWTISMFMTPREAVEFSRIETNTELDSALEKYFSKEATYGTLKRRVLNDKFTVEWKQLLEQCFDSYEKDNYLVTIPTLFIIIEGLMDMLASPKYQEREQNRQHKKRKGKTPNIKEKHRVASEGIERGKFNWVVCQSVSNFLEVTFKYTDFEKERPAIINRNWVLHGRDNPRNWKRADALRLFNAIHTFTKLDFSLKGNEKTPEEAIT